MLPIIVIQSILLRLQIGLAEGCVRRIPRALLIERRRHLVSGLIENAVAEAVIFALLASVCAVTERLLLVNWIRIVLVDSLGPRHLMRVHLLVVGLLVVGSGRVNFTSLWMVEIVALGGVLRVEPRIVVLLVSEHVRMHLAMRREASHGIAHRCWVERWSIHLTLLTLCLRLLLLLIMVLLRKKLWRHLTVGDELLASWNEIVLLGCSVHMLLHLILMWLEARVSLHIRWHILTVLLARYLIGLVSHLALISIT